MNSNSNLNSNRLCEVWKRKRREKTRNRKGRPKPSPAPNQASPSPSLSRAWADPALPRGPSLSPFPAAHAARHFSPPGPTGALSRLSPANHPRPSSRSPNALAHPRPTPLAALPDPHVSFALFLPRLPLAQQKSAGDLAVICSLGAHAQDRLSRPVFSAPSLWNPDPHLATPPQTLARDPPCSAAQKLCRRRDWSPTVDRRPS